MNRTAAAGGTVIAVLALVITALAWLFPDPLKINDLITKDTPPVSTPTTVDNGPRNTVTVPVNPGPIQPDIEISPKSGSPGTTVTVKGTGFPANAEIDVTFHVFPGGETRSDKDGAFEVKIQVPAQATSKTFPWSITANSGAFHASESFTIT